MFRHILVPLDASDLAEAVLPHVVALATTFDARVTLTHVLEAPPSASSTITTDPVSWELARSEATSYLDRVASTLARDGVTVSRHLLEGVPATNVVAFADAHDVDVIALASHGRSGLLGWNLGSVSQKVALHGRVSLFIVRSWEQARAPVGVPRYERIVLPLDGSQRAECVLQVARAMAERHDAKVTLLHVTHDPEFVSRVPVSDDERDLARRFAEMNRRRATAYLTRIADDLMHAGGRVDVRIEDDGDHVATLHRVAGEVHADLVILAAHGATGSDRWPFGATASNVLAYGATPLLVVQDRSPGEMLPSDAERAARERPGHR